MTKFYWWALIYFLCNSVFCSQKLVRVLSIDAGGIRGIIAAKVLEEIEFQLKKPIASTFDLVAGSSSGALLALGLTLDDGMGKPKYSASDLVQFYKDLGKKAFHRSFGRKFWSLNGWYAPKYSTSGIKKLLKVYFGQSRLSEAITPVLITEYHADLGKGFVLTSFDAQKSPNNSDCLLTEAARAAVAAPTFFKATKINFASKVLLNVIDGAVYAYNPALLAYSEAKKHFPHAEILEVYSLGTGGWHPNKKNIPNIQSGKFHWAPIISTHLLLGQIESTNKILENTLNKTPNNYFHRLDIPLVNQSRCMDDTSEKNVQNLTSAAQKLIKSQSMKKVINQLKTNFRTAKISSIN